MFRYANHLYLHPDYSIVEIAAIGRFGKQQGRFEMRVSRRAAAVLLGLSAVQLAAALAVAVGETFPNKSVRIVVPFATGLQAR
jgi:hypothetical protein